MAARDQRSDTDCRGVEGRPGIRTGFSLGRTAVTGWALTAVLGLAGFGTVLGAGPVPLLAPVPVADTTPLGEVGAIARGSAPAVAPRTLVRIGRVGVAAGDGVALPMDTVTAASVPTAVAGPMGTVTAASVPTAAAGPAGMVVAPGLPGLAGGATPTTAATAPAGPAAQLRQAAFTAAAPDQRAS